MKVLKGFKGWAKLLAVGALALSISIPAGAASAASSSTVYNISTGTLTTAQLNSLLAANTAKLSATTTASFSTKVVTLVNQQRAKAGLKPVKISTKLSASALKKAKDMKVNRYFSHNSPILGTPFQLMKKLGITYRYAAENIAMGQSSPAQVMKDWMNSKAHRSIIMSSKYKYIGVAYYQGEWVQHFTG